MDRFFVFALYQPRPGAFEKPIMAGRFCSVKDYSLPPAPASPGGVWVETQKSAEGPLGSGQVFLNPANKGDAIAIQRRLAELGHYHMKVDGDFGKGSRRALQSFRAAVGLGNSANWDLETQVRLFQGSGR